jgi:hypothetical protein
MYNGAYLNAYRVSKGSHLKLCYHELLWHLEQMPFDPNFAEPICTFVGL